MFLRFLENRIENNVILREAIWSSFHSWGPVRGGVRLDNVPGILWHDGPLVTALKDLCLNPRFPRFIFANLYYQLRLGSAVHNRKYQTIMTSEWSLSLMQNIFRARYFLHHMAFILKVTWLSKIAAGIIITSAFQAGSRRK